MTALQLNDGGAEQAPDQDVEPALVEDETTPPSDEDAPVQNPTMEDADPDAQVSDDDADTVGNVVRTGTGQAGPGLLLALGWLLLRRTRSRVRHVTNRLV